MSKLRKTPELILWYRLLREKMFRQIFHFYGIVWVASFSLVIVSLTMLFHKDIGNSFGSYGPTWIWVIICAVTICWGYSIGKVAGSIDVNIFSVFVPSVVLVLSENGNDLNWMVFAKGAGVFIGLVLFTFLVYKIAPLPYFLAGGYRHWPHRRAIVFILVISGIVSLELLRLVIGLIPSLQLPWQPIVTSFMVERGWPYAICLWIWFNIAYLLSNYDHELLPPLLRRIGMGNVPDQLSLDDAYMIEYLLAELPNRPDL